MTLLGHTRMHGKCRLPGTTGTGLFRPTHRFKPHKHSHANALSAFNEAAEFAAGGHVDVATAEGLLHALPAVDPDAVWTHLQHHSIGLSSVAGFFDTLQTTLHGQPMPLDSVPLASLNLDFAQLDGLNGFDFSTDNIFSECYMPPADLQQLPTSIQDCMSFGTTAADHASAFADASLASVSSVFASGLNILPDAAAAVSGGAVASLADAAQASQASQYLTDLAVWAGQKLSVLEFVDPEAFEGIRGSLTQLVDALQSTISSEAQREASQYTNALVLGIQQLAVAISLPAPGGVASINGMIAAQEAAGTATSMLRLQELMKIALGVMAMIIAAIPRDNKAALEEAALQNDPSDAIPLRYDPDALSEYFSRRPVLVMKRNAVVVAHLVSFLSSLLLDWQLGKIEANMPLRARQLREIGEGLGPAYIKIAQAMSTRVDLVPEPYLKEFAKLQDNVPPFCTIEARQVLETSLGRAVDSIFEWLSEEPLAAASLGQVYRGKLRESYGGREVAVKVQRPGVLQNVSLDIFIMRRAAAIFSQLPGMSGEWANVLDEWAMRFFMEMDYVLEAENTSTFRLQMLELEGIKVAEVHPELVSREVIVTEWIVGEKLSESSAEDVQALCSTLLNCYLIQLLETGFLHADPHPGNLLRTPDGHIAILDFGLMTEVTEEQRILLVEFIAHLTLNDWVAISRDLEGFGFFPGGLKEGEREHVLPLLEKVMMVLVNGGGLSKGFSIGGITAQLDNVARNFHMVVPPYFGLILRAFSTIEGIALRVDPKYAIVQECLPYLSKRLLTDCNPRMRTALRQMLYGDSKRINVQRLQKLMSALGNFSTAPMSAAIGPTISAAHDERVKGRTGPLWAAAKGGGGGGPEDDPMLSSSAKEALKVVFSKDGSFAQELVVEEMVATIDAMSKEALGEALKMVMSSAGAMATIRSMEALGPLRMMLVPVPLPMEMLSSMQPRVQLSEDDRQALLMFRTVLDMLQPAVMGVPFAAAEGRRAARMAGELMPLMPELMPGIQHTTQMFIKAMVRRLALRVADELDPSSAPSPPLQAHQQGQYFSSPTPPPSRPSRPSPPAGKSQGPAMRSTSSPKAQPASSTSNPDSWDRRVTR